ncbi:hypothetical protein KPL70_023426 [Citrus sinensis]|nr:hypothetical protein KPL70_023426 [Citrus sinensis]
MATQYDSTFREGQSTTRPPFFDGNDYSYWKTMMRIYLQALDYEIWEVVCDGPFMPLAKNEVGEDIPKLSREWNELEKKKAYLNFKSMNALFCVIDKKKFHRVSSCESANEIWHKLEVVYEGTNQVIESKISRYTRQYELFQMEQNESVYSMYSRFTDIVNTLGTLGKTFSNSGKVKKIIKSLPKECIPKRTVIREAKDLNILPIDDLIGSLISYEEDLAAERGNEEKKKSIALKATKYESDGENHRFFNDVLPSHLLPDLSAPHRSHPPPFEGPSHSTSPDSEDLMQQLLTKVDSLSEQQGKLQSQLEASQLQSISERERLFEPQQGLFNQ